LGTEKKKRGGGGTPLPGGSHENSIEGEFSHRIHPQKTIIWEHLGRNRVETRRRKGKSSHKEKRETGVRKKCVGKGFALLRRGKETKNANNLQEVFFALRKRDRQNGNHE